MTIKELADAIRNNVFDALKGNIADVSYNRTQIISQCFLLRNDLLYKDSLKSKYDLYGFYQTIDSIPIKEMDISTNPIVKSGICTSYIEFPKVSSLFNNIAIDYIGMNNKDINAKTFNIYYDDRLKMHQFKSSRIKSNPFIFVDLDVTDAGMVRGFLYNLNKFKDLQYLTVRAIFEDPTNLLNIDCCVDMLDDEFPAPDRMQNTIIDIMTDKFVTYYRKMNIPDFPNTLTDIKA